MDKICPMLECKECIWWRPFLMTNKEKGTTKTKMQCGIEVILTWIPDIQARLEGTQQATEENRNYILTMARAFARHGVTEPWEMLQRHEGVKQIGELGNRKISRTAE